MDEQSPTTFSVPLVEHAGTPFPADVDVTVTRQRYVGFFENPHGEQLVYVHEHGADPVVYHGDFAWDPVTATMPARARQEGLAYWHVGNMILDETEALWLAGCLAASGAITGNAAEAIADQLVKDAMQSIEEMPAEQRDKLLREARAEAKKRRS
jgi:hypothetical protein